MAWANQSVPPVTLRSSHIHVCPHPRRTSRKSVGGIGRMGGGATEQTFFIPGVPSSTVAMLLRILPERLVQICLYQPRRTCPYTSIWSPFCLYNLPWVSTTRHSHNLCPSTLNVPKLACAGPCDTTCEIARHQSPISGAVTTSRGNFIEDQRSPVRHLCR
jgi:hypothetical protein